MADCSDSNQHRRWLTLCLTFFSFWLGRIEKKKTSKTIAPCLGYIGNLVVCILFWVTCAMFCRRILRNAVIEREGTIRDRDIRPLNRQWKKKNGGLFRVGVCILYMAQRHIIATTNHPVCRLNLLLGIERKQRRDSVSTIERGLKKRKKRWTLERRGGGIFSAGHILLTLAFGKDFYSFYKAFSVPPSPNWAAHGGHLPYTFCLLPTPPTGSIVPTPLSREMPPVFYCKLPSDHLFLSSVTARQPSFASPMGPVFSPSIVMPVVKNSDPIVDFPFFFLSSSSSIP